MSDEKKQIRKIPKPYLESRFNREDVDRAMQEAREERLNSPNPFEGADFSEAPRLVAKPGKERPEEE